MESLVVQLLESSQSLRCAPERAGFVAEDPHVSFHRSPKTALEGRSEALCAKTSPRRRGSSSRVRGDHGLRSFERWPFAPRGHRSLGGSRAVRATFTCDLLLGQCRSSHYEDHCFFGSSASRGLDGCSTRHRRNPLSTRIPECWRSRGTFALHSDEHRLRDSEKAQRGRAAPPLSGHSYCSQGMSRETPAPLHDGAPRGALDMQGGFAPSTRRKMDKALSAFALWLQEFLGQSLFSVLSSAQAAALALRAFGLYLYSSGQPRYLLVYAITSIQGLSS